MKKLLVALFILLPVVAHAQPKTKAALTTEVNSNFASGTAITALTLRTTVLDIINSYYDTNGATSSPCPANQFINSLPSVSSIACAQPTIANIAGWGTGVATALGNPAGGTGGFATNAQLASYLALAGGTMAGNLLMGGFSLTGLPAPSSASDAATKAYVDSVATGLNVLASSTLATAAVLPNSPTYANGTLGVGATLTAGSNTTLTVDGSVASINAVVLVKNQAAPAQNGIYSVTTAGSGSAAWVLTRVTYFDQAAEMVRGSYTFVSGGTVNVNSSFTLQTAVTTVGTDPLTWALFAVNGTSIAGVSGPISLDSTLKMTSTTLGLSTGVVYLKNYGAVCDGSTHDEVAFQNALNAAISAGAPLQLPAGTCVLNANITNGTASSTITAIQGYGSSSIISFLGNTGFAFNANASYYSLHDFNLACQATSANPCLKIYNSTQSSALSSVIQNLYISNSGAYGMYFQNMAETALLNNVIVTNNTAGIGLYVDNTQTADVGANVVHGNTIVNIAGGGQALEGIYYKNAGGTHTSTNNIGGYAYAVYYENSLTSGSATGILVENNQIDNFSTAGIWFTATATGGAIGHLNISGNTLHAHASLGSGSVGIFLVQGTPTGAWIFNAAVNGNTIDTLHGSGGIVVQATGTFTVNSNSIFDQGGATTANAITTSATSSSCVLVGNAISQYSVHISNLGGCTVTGNN